MSECAYPPYEIPSTLESVPIESWQTRDWREMLRLFEENIPLRMSKALEFLGIEETGTALTDLVRLGEASRNVFADPGFSFLQRHSATFGNSKVVVPIETSTVLSESGEGLAADIGLFMARHLASNVDTEWRIDLKKRSADWGKPVLYLRNTKFPGFPLFNVPAVCAIQMISGRANTRVFYETYLNWLKLFTDAEMAATVGK